MRVAVQVGNRRIKSSLSRIMALALLSSTFSILLPPQSALAFGNGTSVNSCTTNLSTLAEWTAIAGPGGSFVEPADDQQVNSGPGNAGDMIKGTNEAPAFWKIDANCAYFKFMLDTNPLDRGKLQGGTQYLMALGDSTDGAKA